MAIQRIVKVENIGRLVNLNAAGDVAFRKLTLVYGDNGSGKTSLTAIFRSAASGNPAPINERATLGVTGSPAVSLLTDAGLADFAGGAWTTTTPAVEVFDDSFVRENVYAGDVVDKEQRKNLYHVVVGPTAVALARRIDQLDSESRSLSRRISELEGTLQQHVQAPFSISEFLALTPVPDAVEHIAQLTRDLSAARNARTIVSRPELARLQLPRSPRQVQETLAITISSGAQAAYDQVRSHIGATLDERGETWLRQGLNYLRNDTCPFCTQSVSDIDIIDLYHQYFSAAYEQQITRLQQALNEVESTLSTERLGQFERSVVENDGRINAWSDLVDLRAANVDAERVRIPYLRVRSILTEALRRKIANPSSPNESATEIEAAIRDYEAIVAEMVVANSAIAEANAQIATVKQRASSADEAAIERQLRRLRNSQIRQAPEVENLVATLTAAQERKTAVEQEKATTRQTLVAQAEALLASYENDINRILRSFGASFTLKGTAPSFAGGRASSTYKLNLNNTELDVGDSSTPAGTPCFRSVLSAGDKSALALSFFLARLERDPNIGDKIIIFDDPLTSLDAFRTSYTQQFIVRLSGRAKQVVVLSHDPFFLKGIRDLSDGETKALRLARASSTYTLKEWDIAHHCMSEAHRDYFILRKFLDDGLPDGTAAHTVARSIRPYIEGYLRNRFPDKFAGKKMLGNLIEAIRQAGAGDELVSLQSRLTDLEDLNSFARRAHHASEGGPPVTEAEVAAYATRALEFVRA